MPINPVTKGKTGEQEIARELNVIFNAQLLKLGFPTPKTPIVQRNQNQSAVGGKDLTLGGLPLAIEVKRQEALAVDTWWAQCELAARRNGEFPILIYRQNQRKWSVVMYANLTVSPTCSIGVRATVKFPDFLLWFREYVRTNLESGWTPKL